MRLKIAARRSDLARLQAQMVARALQARFEGLEIEFFFRESLGDQNLNQPLWQMPEKGVFTADLRGELLRGACDLVVHSWKDLPVDTGPETAVVATLPRAAVQDLLLVRKDRWPVVAATGRINILTSSPRRIRNLPSFLKEALPASISTIDFTPVRGNMQTRVRKMWQPDVDGLILARAALERLLEAAGPGEDEYAATRTALREALGECRWMVLPVMESPSAPAQGALAIEIASDRDDLRQLLGEINCAATFRAVQRERQILRSHGGGCHQAIGVNVLVRPYGEITVVRGLDEAGGDVSRTELTPARPRPPRIAGDRLWPHSADEQRWFRRESLPVEPPPPGLAWWIARADALPEGWLAELAGGATGTGSDQIVWTSGLRTWQRLARRGVWVNGSAEGLGEQELPSIETLAGRSLEWVKLSHDEAGSRDEMRTLATYRLVESGAALELDPEAHDYLFWTSGSNFRLALARAPWLREKIHFCGPGNTYRALVEAGIEPHVFLDQEQWRREMSL